MKTGLLPVGLSFCQNMRYNTQRKLFWLKEETRKFSSLRPLLPSASFLSGACLCLLKSNQPWKDQILEGGHCRIKASLFCFRLPNFLMIKEPNFFPSLSLPQFYLPSSPFTSQEVGAAKVSSKCLVIFSPALAQRSLQILQEVK